jgi:ABC-type branched-subunit amino acid transport system substrate-binding protein
MKTMHPARNVFAFTIVWLATACSRGPAASPGAQSKAEPAAIEDIKIGQNMPYSGPASAYGTIGKLEAAYFKRLNEQGGIHGHKIQFMSLDDGYSPPKAVEQVRKLVEQDQVLLIFQPLGTPSNSAIQKYLNAKKVPQLFAATGATKWGDPEHFPWTIGFNPTYQLEGRTYAKHILEHSPKAKIAVLYQNDDYGKDMLKGLKDGLGAHTNMIVAEATYEVSDATVDSQIATLKGSKADTFVNVTTPKFAAQSIRKVHDIGWKPTHYLNAIGASVGAVLVPAGVEKAIGIMTTAYFMDTNDSQWESDPKMQAYKAFLAKYYPEGDFADGSNTYAYIAAQTMEQTLKQCGDDFSRENIMKQAANLKDFAPDMLLPGVTINTSPTDYFLFDQVQLAKFNGKNWVAQGDVIKVQ